MAVRMHPSHEVITISEDQQSNTDELVANSVSTQIKCNVLLSYGTSILYRDICPTILISLRVIVVIVFVSFLWRLRYFQIEQAADKSPLLLDVLLLVISCCASSQT